MHAASHATVETTFVKEDGDAGSASHTPPQSPIHTAHASQATPEAVSFDIHVPADPPKPAVVEHKERCGRGVLDAD